MARVTSRKSGDVTILDFSGRLIIGEGDYPLREAVHQALEGGAKSILLNLKDTTTIDSSGIGELISGYTRVTNRGGRLKLENLPSKVQDILQITQLITVFEIYDDEKDAVASFA
ncbi:MAG: STAS domain-containing protein [Inquilinus sp.]|uniref:STAS domain-containing protein n=1 Tax=Inquilinus sp. TaxID=1932117 RepID=UPI003F306FBE